MQKLIAQIRGRAETTLAVLLVSMALSSEPAHAYIDPGTGSYVLQVLVAGFLGALFALKMFWHRIATFVRGLGSRAKSHEPSDGPSG